MDSACRADDVKYNVQGRGYGGTRSGWLQTTQTKRLESMARRYLTPGMARLAKRMTVGWRYRRQAELCRAGYREYGERYRHPVIFVAGLPKSGTTWLEKMISSYPGFHELLIPDVAGHELSSGGSHDYELPDDMFERFGGMLVLTKMHVHGSAHNVEVLGRAKVPYIVLFRDLRDVAVSHLFYVKNTPWHPEYPLYRDQSVEGSLVIFAERMLGAYVEWVGSWSENRDVKQSVILQYEQLLEDDGRSGLQQIAELCELPRDADTIQRIVEANSFQRMSGGRQRGQQQTGEFVRKGVAGDWKNHFTEELKELYKPKIGQFLIDFGYEADMNW
jgi:alcohol sulfotransferase